MSYVLVFVETCRKLYDIIQKYNYCSLLPVSNFMLKCNYSLVVTLAIFLPSLPQIYKIHDYIVRENIQAQAFC